MTEPAAPKKDKRRSGGTLRFILLVALVAWVVRSLIFAPFSIPSGSMLPTLYIGDYLLVAKWPYGYSRYSFPFEFPSFDGRILGQLPKRGDIVVFVRPGNEGEDFVKRVIGLPGDTVEMRDGRVVLNGRALARGPLEPVEARVSPNSPCRRVSAGGLAPSAAADGKCIYLSYLERLPDGATYRVYDQVRGGMGDSLPATTVPEGHLFLMGDNRDDSLDSRFSPAEGGIGFVPLDHVVGRATAIFWSTDGSATYIQPWTWFSALRTDRVGKTLGAR